MDGRRAATGPRCHVAGVPDVLRPGQQGSVDPTTVPVPSPMAPSGVRQVPSHSRATVFDGAATFRTFHVRLLVCAIFLHHSVSVSSVSGSLSPRKTVHAFAPALPSPALYLKATRAGIKALWTRKAGLT